MTTQKIDDGGPAANKSLRFETAQMAMQGIISSLSNYQNELDMVGKVTEISFCYADAMIAASRKDQST